MSDESLQNRQQWKPNVKVSYRINAKASNVRQFDASSVDTQRIGLPIGQSPLKVRILFYEYKSCSCTDCFKERNNIFSLLTISFSLFIFWIIILT